MSLIESKSVAASAGGGVGSGAGQGLSRGPETIALLGNPNVGKTTLFNRLAGVRHKTANFPGTTQEAHLGRLTGGATAASGDSKAAAPMLIDLPGLYSLSLNQPESEICRAVLAGELAPVGSKPVVPAALLVVLDAANLLRTMVLAAEVAKLGRPMVVAVNMVDLARRRGLHIEPQRLSERLGCPVIAVNARSGEGFGELIRALRQPGMPLPSLAALTTRDALEQWADQTYADVASASEPVSDKVTDRLDAAFTHPVVGVALFIAVMTGLFWVIFRLAAYPMEWIDALFGWAGGTIGNVLPEGAVRSLLVDGMIAGVGATVIFLPQIVLLFFLLSLLEGTGYLARAAFVIDRLLRPFGLSGHAFVPLLSGHACALPGIMAARTVPDRRDRIATILAIPFMSCTARIPVYALLTTLLFPGRPGLQALAFTGCYVLGVAAGLMTSLIFRRTILKGASRAMAMELPSYRLPDVRFALLTTRDRAWVFLRKAGVVILGISVVLWWLGTYPQSGPSPEGQQLRAQAMQVEPGLPASEQLASTMLEEADALDQRYAASRTALGRMGTALQPVFAPLGFDRQLTIGVLASFAAREVFVSTMAVQVVGRDDLEETGSLIEAIGTAKRDDGSLIFTAATSWSLLVYYVLAMQCLPTLAVTARETGSWKWAGLQLGWMSLVAYVFAMLAYQIARAAGLGV
jgi:ferrous iron transport protein B